MRAINTLYSYLTWNIYVYGAAICKFFSFWNPDTQPHPFTLECVTQQTAPG